eukprot:UC4_evm3s945
MTSLGGGFASSWAGEKGEKYGYTDNHETRESPERNFVVESQSEPELGLAPSDSGNGSSLAGSSLDDITLSSSPCAPNFDLEENNDLSQPGHFHEYPHLTESSGIPYPQTSTRDNDTDSELSLDCVTTNSEIVESKALIDLRSDPNFCDHISGKEEFLSDKLTKIGLNEDDADLLEKCRFFHKHISRHVAETLLMTNGAIGRNSENSKSGISLSVRTTSAVKHYQINRSRASGGYEFGLRDFATFPELLTHFNNKPVVGSETGIMTMLRHPYPRSDDIAQPDNVELNLQVRMPTLREVDSLGELPSAAELSVASKEGYLVKQGQFRKSWKRRWFALQKMSLSYFRDVSDAPNTPIKVLDLNKCIGISACTESESLIDQNCFRLTLLDRTLLLKAPSRLDMEQWIEIIKWKINNLGENNDPLLERVGKIKSVGHTHHIKGQNNTKKSDESGGIKRLTTGSLAGSDLPKYFRKECNHKKTLFAR